MAILLPSVANVFTLPMGVELPCGGLDTTAATEIAYLRILLFKHGALGGSERVRAKLYTDNARTRLYATSAWSSVASIAGLSTYWWGWFRLDFARENISKEFVYYVTIEADNYTPSTNVYLSVSLDWPLSQNTQAAARNGVAMQLYGYRD